MRYINKIISAFLLAVILVNTLFSPTLYNASQIVTETTDIYLEGTSEVVEIEGVSYTYYYHFINGNRAIDITDNSTNITETLVYNESDSSICLNNLQIATVFENKENIPVRLAANGWESCGSGSKLITWEEGATVGMVVSLIAAVIGIKYSNVYVAVGGTVLSELVHNATGCTVYYDLQMNSALPATSQYRYEWGFLDTTGIYHGQYFTHIYF